ncbi:lytic transglycosylase domain-containing protein [Deinococcus sp. SL84]|uniref:lytic transglycosylase domain-containing protein n=1 Tax=Deinococcus sp. SL84 TaxID=2994663 RepID=UPI002275756F|nr:lytic transglycosylase domain-containing protein [Deinococcus sp. SL84]MCY1703829.1 lytic transglycosylase domain-containing protein [Deinococcus sp. SL84]
MKRFMMVLFAFALSTPAAAQMQRPQMQGPVPADACPLTERGRWEGGKRVVPDRYMRLVNLYSESEGIPRPLLFAQIWQESSFCQRAVSSAGAIGLMQLMPGTARELGVDPRDAHQNVAGGSRYLARLKRQFGTWEAALAAYNAGPGRVAEHGGQVPPIAETQHYVITIMSQVK